MNTQIHMQASTCFASIICYGLTFFCMQYIDLDVFGSSYFAFSAHVTLKEKSEMKFHGVPTFLKCCEPIGHLKHQTLMKI